MAFDEQGVAGLMTGGAGSLFDDSLSSGGKALSFITGGASGLVGCGGKSKSKPKPWANMPGGKLSYRGKKILEASNYLMPATLDITRRGAEGFGDIYRSEADKTRQDELDAFKKFGPEYDAALDEADPLRKKAKEIILANLDEGLDPAIAREVEQGSRAAWSSRGMLNTPGSAIEEIVARGMKGKQIEDNNLARAMELSRGRDAFMAMSGRPSVPQGSNPMSPNYAGYTDQLPSFQANDEMMRFNASENSKNRPASYVRAGASLAGGAMAFV